LDVRLKGGGLQSQRVCSTSGSPLAVPFFCRVPKKPEDESEQVSQSARGKVYSMTRCSFGPQRLKRVFGIEIEKCEKCGGRVKIIACIEDTDVIEKILKHLGLDEASQARNRSPPSDLFDHSSQLF